MNTRREQRRRPADSPVRQELVQREEHQRDERERDEPAEHVLHRAHHVGADPESLEDLHAARRREREVRAQRRVGDEQQRRHDRDLNVEQLALNDPAIGLDVEHIREHAAQRPEQARRKPDEADRAVDPDRAARADDVDQQRVNGTLARLRVRREQAVDDRW